VALGQIGFFTTVIEALATAVGAGILLGGFLAGSVGSVAGMPRHRLDARVLSVGYAGGVVGLGAVLLDAMSG